MLKGLQRRAVSRGLSVVELLVGLAIGLFVVGGALSMMVSNLQRNRQLLSETRLVQDLRAAADIVARDLRRASYWDDAGTGVWGSAGTIAATPNPYASLDTSTVGQVVYSYQRSGVDPAAGVSLGFRRSVNTAGIGIVELLNAGSGWQALTDPNSVHVSNFSINPVTPAMVVELYPYCSCLTTLKCTSAGLAALSTRPQLVVREYTIILQGQAVVSGAIDSAVTREFQGRVKVRNDELKNPTGCPAA